MKVIKSKPVPDKLLIKNVQLIDPSQNLDGLTDLLIENGKISQIHQNISTRASETLDLRGYVLTPGLFDMHVHLREPGFESKETIETGGAAAAHGGFTGVACMPNTEPAIDKPDVVARIQERAKDLAVDIFCIGAVTVGRKGEELSPMVELIHSGVTGFSDDGSPVWNSVIMRNALEYIRPYSSVIIQHAEDPKLFEHGVMNEGLTSTKLGLHGIPTVAEEMMVARDLLLAKYTHSRIHFAHISTRGSVELIRRAKQDGVNVTCDVTPHHFSLTDEAVIGYDTNTKMNPPLRSKKDLAGLLDGLKDGTIDCIATDHAPHTREEKEREYNHAPFGIIGLETSLGLAITKLVQTNVLSLPQLIDKMAIQPRKILNIPPPQIKVGEPANVSIFHPAEKWIVDIARFESKSVNTPFGGMDLVGKPWGIINRGQIVSESIQ